MSPASPVLPEDETGARNSVAAERTGEGPPPVGAEAAAGPAEAAAKKESPKTISSTLPAQATATARLEAFLNVFHGDDRVLIVISADPDAMASAAAVKRMLWRRAAQVTVASLNQVKRPDNLQLLDILKFKMEPFKSLNPADYSRLVMVDSQPNHSPLTENLPFDAVIDHHPSTPPAPQTNPAYVDIRPDIGATATMMVSYLKADKIKPNQKLATALFYAIKTDTNNFVRQGQLEDMIAFRWLYPFIQPQLLSEIERAPIARSSYKKIVAGLSGAVFYKSTVHSFMGKADHADTLVIVADFLMQIKGISRATVSGISGDKLVVIFRGAGPRQDMGKLAKEAFGNIGSAGGHKSMARAEVPLENLDPKIRNNPVNLKRFVLRSIEGHGDHPVKKALKKP